MLTMIIKYESFEISTCQYACIFNAPCRHNAFIDVLLTR